MMTMKNFAKQLALLIGIFPVAVLAQQDTPVIPVTIEVATDGSSPQNSYFNVDINNDNSIDATKATPASNERWHKKSAQQNLEFGQAIDFDLNDIVSPSMRGSISGSSASGVSAGVSYHSASNSDNWNMWDTGTFTQCIEGEDDDESTVSDNCSSSSVFGCCDGSCSVSVSASASASSSSNFSNGLGGETWTYWSLNDNGNEENLDMSYSNKIADIEFLRAMVVGLGDELFLESATQSGWWQCAGSTTDCPSSCNRQDYVSAIENMGDVLEITGLFQWDIRAPELRDITAGASDDASASASDDCSHGWFGSCSASASATASASCNHEASIRYRLTSSTGYAWSGAYTALTGTIGTDVYISKVEADIDGSAPDQLDLWLEHPDGTRLHLYNNHSHSGSNHNIDFVDGNSVIGNNYSNNSSVGAYGGSINDTFQGKSPEGQWKLRAFDKVSGHTHNIDNFAVHFEKSPGVNWTTPTASANSTQTIGDHVYLTNVAINHNCSGNTGFVLRNTTTGASFDLGHVSSGANTSVNGLFEGANVNDNWRITASSPAQYVDQNNSISSWSLSFSGVGTDNCYSSTTDRQFAGRIYTNHYDPGCSNAEGHIFYQAPGTSAPARDLITVVRRVEDNENLNEPIGDMSPTATPGLRYVHIGHGVYDAYDLANDRHFTGALLDNNNRKGKYVCKDADNLNYSTTASYLTVQREDYDPLGLAYSNGSLSRELVPGENATKNLLLWSNSNGYPDAGIQADNSDNAPDFHLMNASDISNINNGALYNGGVSNSSIPSFRTSQNQWTHWMAVTPDNMSANDPIDGSQEALLDIYQLGPNTWHHDNLATWYLGDPNLGLVDNAVMQANKGSNISFTNPALQAASGQNSSVEIAPIDLRNVNHGMWESTADVQTFYSTELVTYYERGNLYEDGIIHVSFPITAPRYDITNDAHIPYDGDDAMDMALPYWGFPNGVEGFGEMHVKLTNRNNGATYATTVNSADFPLMRKDCPYILQDSLRMEISVEALASAGFYGGDEVDVECMALWTTDARRTALWSYKEVDNRLILCTDFNQGFAMVDNLIETPDYNAAVSTTTVTWNQGELSSGGYMRLQRRNASNATGPEDGWEYFNQSGTSENGVTGSSFLTTDLSQARIWQNKDVLPSGAPDGNADAIAFVDNSLQHSQWQCEIVEYRIEQEMCGEYFTTQPVALNIMGQLENPWVVDGVLSNGIFVSQGRYPYKVRIDWSTATDQNDIIDQFRVYRRIYTPADPDPDAWEQIFSSEDFTWYIDQDVAAGTLYEYKVGAVIDCGEDPQGNVQIQEFFTAPPYDIGFRTNIGLASGEVLFENGSPSDSVYVVVEPQGTMNARNAIVFPESTYLKMDIPSAAERSAVWPEINSHDATAEWSISEWIKVPSTTVTNNAGPDFSGIPIMGFNAEDSETQDVSEVFGIYAIPNSETTYQLALRQAGVDFLFAGMVADLNAYNHLIITLTNEGGAVNAIRVHARMHPDASDVQPQMHASLVLDGIASDFIEAREGWHSITWNAAAYGAAKCNHPNGNNFEPLSVSGALSSCNYNTPTGCSDPTASNYNSAASWDYPLGDTDACNYTQGAGEMLSIRWFSDGSETATEYPVIIDANTQCIIKDFRSDIIDAASQLGSGNYAYTMPVLKTSLPPGDYSIRVLDSSSPVSACSWSSNEAAAFFGNFSLVNDRGFVHVNCLQYLPESEVNSEGTWLAEGEYDFSISSQGCSVAATVTNISSAVDNVMTDCATCYSTRFLNNANLDIQIGQPANIGASGTYELWFKANGVTTGDILKIWSGSDHMTLSLESDNTALNQGGMKFSFYRNSSPISAHSGMPEGFNEFIIHADKWYHVAVNTGSNGGLILRGTDYNDNDLEAWNNTREWNWGQEGASGINTLAAPSRIVLGGADVSIHRVSIWSGLTNAEYKAHAATLFDDVTSGDFAQASFINDNGVWTPTPTLNGLKLNNLECVLVPDNSGRMVDQMLGKQLWPGGTPDPNDPSIVAQAPTLLGTGSLETSGGQLVGSINGNRKAVRCAPLGLCNPGCSRVFNACNFNPFANQFQDCQLSCAGVSTDNSVLNSHATLVDEIRGFGPAPFMSFNDPNRVDPNVPDANGVYYGASGYTGLYAVDYQSWEVAALLMQRYPNNLTPGMFLMYDGDEGLGNVVYDRSKFGADLDSWNHVNGHLYAQGYNSTTGEYSQASADSSLMYFGGLPRPLPLTLGNWEYSNPINGSYIIPNVKYTGTSSMFDIKPSKSSSGFSHNFMPAQQVALIGDILLAAENKDFTDVSAFEVTLRATYQDFEPALLNGSNHGDYSLGTGNPSDCPVEGVSFLIDGVVYQDSASNDVTTDSLGYATVYLARGPHTFVPQLKDLDEDNPNNLEDDHVFGSGSGGILRTITGPIAQDQAISFVDITTRRVVGRIIGGNEEAAKEWGASTNNLGFSSLLLVPQDVTAAVPDLATCPAVKVTTNPATGEYDALILPTKYRPAVGGSSGDADAYFAKYNHPQETTSGGILQVIEIDGWQLANPGEGEAGVNFPGWDYAFRNELLVGDDGAQNPNIGDYMVIDGSKLNAMSSFSAPAAYNQADGVTGIPTTGAAVYDRQDMVYTAPTEISAYQKVATTAEECSTSTTRSLDESQVGNRFLGETRLFREVNGRKWLSPLDGYLYHAAAAPNEQRIVFPAGLPIIQQQGQYCMQIQAIQKYQTSFSYPDINGTNQTVANTTDSPVYGPSYELSFYNSLATESTPASVNIPAAEGYSYFFKGGEPAQPTAADPIPRGQLTLTLSTPQGFIGWKPWQGMATSTTTGLLKSPTTGQPIFDDFTFDAILMGQYESGEPIPVSTDPTLTMILRDPPGNASYCKVTSGSSIEIQREVETNNAMEFNSGRNISAGFTGDGEGAFLSAPMGIGVSTGASMEASFAATLSQEEKYSKNEKGGVSVTETISFNQEISTSEDVDLSSGDSQFFQNTDLYIGKTRNTGMGFMKRFDITMYDHAVAAGIAHQSTSEIGIPTGGADAPIMPWIDNDGDGALDHLMMMEITASSTASNPTYVETDGNYTYYPFDFIWTTTTTMVELPASMFVFTEQTIETNMILSLEEARDSYFAQHPEYYNWPFTNGATNYDASVNVPTGFSYPKDPVTGEDLGMRLANNDDHRWDLYHKDWLTNNASQLSHPAASSIERGYQVPSGTFTAAQIEAGQAQLSEEMANMSNLYPDAIPASWATSLVETVLTADDRKGPGYIFNVTDAQLAAAKLASGNDKLTPLGLDSVRYFNNQIAAWSKIIAQNEFEKANARAFINANMSSYSDVDSLTSFIDALDNSATDAMNFNLEDLGGSSAGVLAGTTGEVDIWSDADFEPFFLSFSGGGSSFTQTIEKTNSKTETHAKELSAVYGGGFGLDFSVNGGATGYAASKGMEFTQTEERTNSQTDESTMSFEFGFSDPEAKDYYLVGVVPGRGANGPIFLTYGGKSSCPFYKEVQSEYWEWFPALIPGSYNPNSAKFDCDKGKVTEPVWARSPSTNISFNTTNGQLWQTNNLGAYIGTVVAGDVLAGGMTAAAAGAAAATGSFNIALFNASGSVLAFTGAGLIAGAGVADIALTGIWRAIAFAGIGGFNDSNRSHDMTGSLKETELFISSKVCAAMKPDASVSARNSAFQLQPATVAVQKPRLTVSYDYPQEGIADVTEAMLAESLPIPASALMTQPIGLTLHMAQMADEPHGGSADYFLYSDMTANEPGASINIGGTGGAEAGTIGYTINPIWDPNGGVYNVPVVIDHSGVEQDEFMSGSVTLIMESLCDSEINDAVIIDLAFDPACSPLELVEPFNNWSANLEQVSSGPYTDADSIRINIDIEKNNFKNWDLDEDPVVVEYLAGSGTQWTKISNVNAFGTAGAVSLGADSTVADFNFNWNPKQMNDICADGNPSDCDFEGPIRIRARSQCQNLFAEDGTSAEITGQLDYKRPQIFGQVLPLDQKYGLGDEMKIRWDEAMETSLAGKTLNPDSIVVEGTLNGNFADNSGGLTFSESEYLAVLEGPNFDTYIDTLEVGFSGWSMSTRIWGGGTAAPSGTELTGVLFSQGDDATASLTVEFLNASTLKLSYKENGAEVASGSSTINLTAPWAPDGSWNSLRLDFQPAGNGSYSVIAYVNTVDAGNTSVGLPGFNLPSRRITIGNGWSNGAATAAPLTALIQDVRFWSSQRETNFSEVPNLNVLGNELGLQVWLPLNELSGTPIEQARGRVMQMQANWASTNTSHALDFASNASGQNVILNAAGFGAITPGLSRDMTFEFWFKPDGANQGILGINGTADPDLDLNGSAWSFETDGLGRLAVANKGDTLYSPAAISNTWHHVAVIRDFNGAVTLYLDGNNVASAAAGSHGPLIPAALFAGARQFGTSTSDIDRLFTGKLDEVRCWNVALPLATIQSRTRDAVYGYNHLYLHLPFESRGTVTQDQAYTYNQGENLMGYDYNFGAGNNDATSMEDAELFTPNATVINLTNAGSGGTLSSFILSDDAVLMQASAQVSTSEPGDISSVSWNSLADECIIEMNPAKLWKYEDQVVTFSLPQSQLNDEAGNSSSWGGVFKMKIERNPLKWSTDNMMAEVLTSDTKSFTTSIINSGFESKVFEIVGAPSWMEVTPSSGVIGGDEEITITMTAPEFMDIGQYEFDLMLKGGLACGSANSAPPGFCYGERFTFGMDVYIETPVFEVDEWAYQNVMPVIAKVYNFNVASSDPRDVVLAYINGQLRGHNAIDMTISGNQLAFLSIFYNDSEVTENIEFRVWDASEGLIRAQTKAHWPTLDSDELTLNPSESGIGSPLQPLLLRATDDVEVSNTVHPGWNWVSFNVAKQDGNMSSVQASFSSLPQDQILNVKAHGLGSYNTGGTWSAAGLSASGGDAARSDMRYMLEMKTDNPDAAWTLTNVGKAIHPEDAHQTLVHGWNELGFIPQQEMSLEDALRSLSDADTVLVGSPIIKSRYDGFAAYTDDGEWVGTLNSLKPGHGYRLKIGTPGTSEWSSGSPSGILEWPETGTFFDAGWRSNAAMTGMTSPDAPWQMNVRGMEASMTMIIRLELPTNHFQSVGDALGAFITNGDGLEQCVGQAIPIDTDDGLLYFLTAFGNASDLSELSFRWKSGITELEEQALETLAFTGSEVKGTLSAPYLLHFRSLEESVIPAVDGGLIAYPNPFLDDLTIHWHGTEKVKELRIEDANGRLVNLLDCDDMLNGPCRWNASGLESGVYFIRAITKESTHIVRVIK